MKRPSQQIEIFTVSLPHRRVAHSPVQPLPSRLTANFCLDSFFVYTLALTTPSLSVLDAEGKEEGEFIHALPLVRLFQSFRFSVESKKSRREHEPTFPSESALLATASVSPSLSSTETIPS
ncbi:hypothetical protein TRVL_04770 [Trypanosoma vivax]|nr:hypothetical protein TRVL_04770 [Trypanosoma vivax]